MQGRPRRSVLYMPGSNERALEKAKTIPADALIFDLEDAVTPNAKPLARDQVCAAVRNGDYGGREIVIRVNALETPWGTDDLLAACEAAPDAILVPKVAHPGDIISAAKILQGVHAAEKIRLWAMMETPMAILNARTIAATAVYAEHPALLSRHGHERPAQGIARPRSAQPVCRRPVACHDHRRCAGLSPRHYRRGL
jgi:citrate lyase subunit beta/citryl-CoA lyase